MISTFCLYPGTPTWPYGSRMQQKGRSPATLGTFQSSFQEIRGLALFSITERLRERQGRPSERSTEAETVRQILRHSEAAGT